MVSEHSVWQWWSCWRYSIDILCQAKVKPRQEWCPLYLRKICPLHFRSLRQFYSVNKHTHPSGTPSEAFKFASTRLTHVSPGCCHQVCALESTGRYCLYRMDRNHIPSVCSTSPVSLYILRLPPYILLRAGLFDTSPVLEYSHYSPHHNLNRIR